MLRAVKDESNKVLTRANRGREGGRRGKLGAAYIWLEKASSQNFYLNFVDVGSYGRNRWDVRVTLTADQLKDMISTLQALQKGQIKRTLDDVPEMTFKGIKARGGEVIPVQKKRMKAEEVPSAPTPGGNGRHRRKQDGDSPAMHQ
jgi:hypothetical protein